MGEVVAKVTVVNVAVSQSVQQSGVLKDATKNTGRIYPAKGKTQAYRSDLSRIALTCAVGILASFTG